jgi:hypothetical protein
MLENWQKVPRWLTLCGVFFYCSFGLAAPYSPKPGSHERKAILDALRVPVERVARQKVVFHGVSIKVEKGWAFVHAISMDKAGKKAVLGDLDTAGLLRKQNGRWKVLHWGVAGDIGVVCEAAKKYPQAPKAIFGGALSGCSG